MSLMKLKKPLSMVSTTNVAPCDKADWSSQFWAWEVHSGSCRLKLRRRLSCRGSRDEFLLAVAVQITANWMASQNQKCTLSRFWRSETSQFELNSNCGQGCTPTGDSGENLFLASSRFQWLLAFLDLWLHCSSLCFHGHMEVTWSSSVCIWTPSLRYEDTYSWI